MPKRQSTNTINATAFQNLLAIQASALKTVEEIRDLTAENISTGQKSVVDAVEKSTKVQEETKTNLQKMGDALTAKAKEDSKIFKELAVGMKTFKSVGESLGDKAKSKFGSLSKTLDTMGIVKKDSGGIISNMIGKRDEQKKFIKQQKLLGSEDSDATLKEKYVAAHKTSKAIKKNEASIKEFSDMGMSEDQMRSHKASSGLMAKRDELSTDYAKHDLKAQALTPSGESGAEKEEEQGRVSGEILTTLKSINDNVGPVGAAKKGATPAAAAAPKEGGGLLDTIMGFLGDGFMTAIKGLFNPKSIIKVLGKVFAPLMIIGALVNGIMDGFKEFTETGDIGKALIAGLGGVIEFLTFGLIDKEALSNIIESVSGFVEDYIVKPLSDFFKSVKDSVLALVEQIGIPEIKFTIPVINKDVSIGPFYPFKSGGPTSAAPVATPPASATQVEDKSASNADSAASAPSGGGNVSSTVATNINNTTKQTNIIKSPVRNQDSTMNRYVNSRYA